jgi:alpha-amylase
MKLKTTFLLCIILVCLSCQKDKEPNPVEANEVPFYWNSATIYFLLTDRFNNADPSNDINFGRNEETGFLRGFEGGDLKGITEKLKEGYFSDLGVNAIWLTPIVEQIHGVTDEGTGKTYAYHGYWAKDWTRLDPNFGTKEDLKELVETAHQQNIRIVLDAVVNHTGPVTEKDEVWPEDWVRTSPTCTYQDFETTVTCTLVDNLPDIKTESDEAVELPPYLVAKWKEEGRYEEEISELNTFFEETGYPRAPRFYVMKWLSDYITDFGIDAYRVDTVKHTEPYVWQEFSAICDRAFETWQKNNPELADQEQEFYLLGEVYNYAISHQKSYDFGDTQVNYFDDAFNSLINFELKWNAIQQDYETHFSRYAQVLDNEMKGYGVVNYMTSHDDGNPFDPKRIKNKEAANRLLLSPGTAQIYYGDESARPLEIGGTVGDATLRSFMNWEEIESLPEKQQVLAYWQKLGKFRAKHPSIGAGSHLQIQEKPYVFSRSFTDGDFQDEVIISLNNPEEEKQIDVSSVFKEGDILYDAFSEKQVKVVNGKVELSSSFDTVLLEKLRF